MWLASYRFRGRAYQVSINGRTGEVTGERPYSAIKIAIAVVLALIALVAIGYIVAITGGR